MKVFVELTPAQHEGKYCGFSGAAFPDYAANQEGCGAYQQRNPGNSNIVCLADYDKDKGGWLGIGYTVVNRKGDGKAHPWGTSASPAFRQFAQTEEHCTQMILNYLKQNYPAPELPKTHSARVSSRDPGQKNTGKVRCEEDLSADQVREIVSKNYKLFLAVYERRSNGQTFESSQDVGMFYRSQQDIQKVQEWNRTASVASLIDPCAFNEMILGNDKDPDLVILGKNPGAAGIGESKDENYFNAVYDEIAARRTARGNGLFYPLSSLGVMKRLPWFANRLIFGVGSSTWADERPLRGGILSPFIKRIEDASNLARRIVSLELVPYHTKSFGTKKLIEKFGVVKQVAPIVGKAKERGAVILCPYFGAVDMWLAAVPALKDYPYFYTTHVRSGQENPPQNGSLHVDALRHYSMIGSPREQEEDGQKAVKERLSELFAKKA